MQGRYQTIKVSNEVTVRKPRLWLRLNFIVPKRVVVLCPNKLYFWYLCANLLYR